MAIRITQHDHVRTEEQEGQTLQVDQQDDQKVRLWETFLKSKKQTQTHTYIKHKVKLFSNQNMGPQKQEGYPNNSCS